MNFCTTTKTIWYENTYVNEDGVEVTEITMATHPDYIWAD
jgi:hypothetical protein